MMVRAPATRKARRSPKTPSPALISPTPVSQAERTAHSTPSRSSAATSSAVRMPSSGLARVGRRWLAPASARPESSSGLSGRIRWRFAPLRPPMPRRPSGSAARVDGVVAVVAEEEPVRGQVQIAPARGLALEGGLAGPRAGQDRRRSDRCRATASRRPRLRGGPRAGDRTPSSRTCRTCRRDAPGAFGAGAGTCGVRVGPYAGPPRASSPFVAAGRSWTAPPDRARRTGSGWSGRPRQIATVVGGQRRQGEQVERPSGTMKT